MSSTLTNLSFSIAVCTFLSLVSTQAFGQCSRNHSSYYPQQIYPQPSYCTPVFGHHVVTQPHVVSAPQPTYEMSSADLARQDTTQARVLFKNGNFKSAAEKMNSVVKRVPSDSNAYQFRSLASFASANFDNAAADAYDSLGLGNAWTRDVIDSLYGPASSGQSGYEKHLATLESSAAAKPSMQSHFLLAYHFLINERWSDGKQQLEKVLEIEKGEPLSTKLLAVVEARIAESVETTASTGSAMPQE